MKYANPKTQRTFDRLPTRIGATQIADPTAGRNWHLYRAEGWRKYDGPGPQPPEGYQVSGRPVITQDPRKGREDYAVIEWRYAPIPEPVPDIEERLAALEAKESAVEARIDEVETRIVAAEKAARRDAK
jgi:hypothetical protein